MYSLDGEVEQKLLSQADQAMYIAKHMGRNQVRTRVDVRMLKADLSLFTPLEREEQREMAQR